MTVRRIGVLSLGKVFGVLYLFVGFIIGAIVSLLAVGGLALGAAASQDAGPVGPIFGLLFGVGAIIVLPIFYGTMGFVSGVVMAAIYNVAARFVGGLELEVEGAPGAR